MNSFGLNSAAINGSSYRNRSLISPAFAVTLASARAVRLRYASASATVKALGRLQERVVAYAAVQIIISTCSDAASTARRDGAASIAALTLAKGRTGKKSQGNMRVQAWHAIPPAAGVALRATAAAARGNSNSALRAGTQRSGAGAIKQWGVFKAPAGVASRAGKAKISEESQGTSQPGRLVSADTAALTAASLAPVQAVLIRPLYAMTWIGSIGHAQAGALRWSTAAAAVTSMQAAWYGVIRSGAMTARVETSAWGDSHRMAGAQACALIFADLRTHAAAAFIGKAHAASFSLANGNPIAVRPAHAAMVTLSHPIAGSSRYRQAGWNATGQTRFTADAFANPDRAAYGSRRMLVPVEYRIVFIPPEQRTMRIT